MNVLAMSRKRRLIKTVIMEMEEMGEKKPLPRFHRDCVDQKPSRGGRQGHVSLRVSFVHVCYPKPHRTIERIQSAIKTPRSGKKCPSCRQTRLHETYLVNYTRNGTHRSNPSVALIREKLFSPKLFRPVGSRPMNHLMMLQ